MQLSKVLFVIGATSVCLAPLPGRTADKASVAPLVAPTPAAPDALEKARAAMHQKMDELQPTTPAAASQAPAKAAPAPEPQAPVPAPTPAPAVKAPAPTPAPVPAAEAEAPVRPLIPVADPAALEKAREALHQKMAELNSQPDQPTAKAAQPAVASKPQKAKEQAEVKRKPEAKPKTTKELATNPTAKPIPSQVALTKEQPPAQPEAFTPAQEPKKQAKKTKIIEQAAVEPTAVRTPAGFEPLSAPPSPLSAGKQQRLNDLLTKYKADQISPEQYHAERAKILTEQ